jgi:hypothetical protein
MAVINKLPQRNDCSCRLTAAGFLVFYYAFLGVKYLCFKIVKDKLLRMYSEFCLNNRVVFFQVTIVALSFMLNVIFDDSFESQKNYRKTNEHYNRRPLHSMVPVYPGFQAGCRSHAGPWHTIEVLFVKQTMFILILFASLPECSQNQTAVSDEQYSLSDF